MLGVRALRPATKTFTCTRRSYATPPSPTPSPTPSPKSKPPSDSNWALYLSLAGVTGLAYWVYLQQTHQLVGWGALPPKVTPVTSALDKDSFREFALKKVESYNYNTHKYTFALPKNTATLLPVASCVLIKAADEEAVKDDKGKPVARPYTPISPSELEGEMTFLIKKYDNGKFTPWLASLKPGEKIAVKGPLPKFPYKPNEFEKVAMIAGGSGITPMYQLLTYSLSLPDDKTKWTLIFANISTKDILLREEFDKMQKEHPDRFEAVYVIDKPEESFNGPTGFVTKELIKQHIAPPDLGDKVKVFVCGPPGQVEAVAGKKDGMKQGALGGALKELGYKEEQVFKF